MDDEARSEEELVFRYSRENRLSHASEAVRKLNDPASKKRPSLFQTLAPNRASAFLLLAVFMLSSTVIVTKLLIPGGNTAELAGNRFTLTAFRFQGGTYLALKKSSTRDDAYRGPIDIAISIAQEGAAIATRQVILSSAGAEDFRLSIDGEHEKIQVIVSAGRARVTLKTTSE